MRNAFAAAVVQLAAEDERVVMLSGDIGNRLFDKFKEKFPQRFFNCGVAEASMVSMAAGMAASGLRPVAYTITPFVTTRVMEQIRVDVCYHNVPVVIAGVGAGLSYASLGATHHSCEDIAMLRSLPNMTVVCPADSVETGLALRAALRLNSPVYLRLGKKGEPVVHHTAPEFVIGRGIVLRDGTDVCILNAGTVLPEVVNATETLAGKGVSVRVVSFHTIKPLDTTLLADAFARFKIVATVEEHSLIGGLGSAVAEWLADHSPQKARLCRIGTPDAFLHESGDQRYARERFGLTPASIAGKILQSLK